MLRSPGIASVVLLLCCGMVHAQDGNSTPDTVAAGSKGWRNVNEGISPEDYSKLTKSNLRIVRRTLRTYSEDMLNSLHVPETGIRVMGAAAAGLATGKASMDLDDSGLMALELNDFTDGNRAMYLRFKFDW